MTFGESIRTCIAKTTTFGGRAARSEYWWFYLLVVLGSLCAMMLDGVRFMLFGEGFGSPEEFTLFVVESPLAFYARLIPITMFWYFLTFLPLTAAGWRRFQDLGRPGWLYVAALGIVMAVSVFMLGEMAQEMAPLIRMLADPEAASDVFEIQQDLLAFNMRVTVISGIQSLISIILIIALASPGTRGENRFGKDPTT